MKAVCSHCGAVGTWPDYATGRSLLCRSCGRRFAGEQVGPGKLPPEEPEEEEIYDARPPDSGPLPGMSDEALAISENGRADLSPNRRAVYALLVRTLNQYRPGCLEPAAALLIASVLAPVLGLLSFGTMALAGWGAGWLGGLAAAALLIVPGCVVVFAVGIKQLAGDEPVSLRESDGKTDSFKLGRLDDAFAWATPVLLPTLFAMLLGLQAGLLYGDPAHGGLPVEGGLGQCCLLAVDNACGGVFLDTFELYDLSLTARPRHSSYSATVFYVFRLGFDAVAVLSGLVIYQRWTARRMLNECPWWFVGSEDGATADQARELADWLAKLVASKERWPRRYFDEFAFLALAAAYLRGDDAAVRHWASVFPRLLIADPVRRLFVADDGGRLLPDKPAE